MLEQGFESLNLTLEFMLLITVFVKFKSHKLHIVGGVECIIYKQLEEIKLQLIELHWLYKRWEYSEGDLLKKEIAWRNQNKLGDIDSSKIEKC